MIIYRRLFRQALRIEGWRIHQFILSLNKQQILTALLTGIFKQCEHNSGSIFKCPLKIFTQSVRCPKKGDQIQNTIFGKELLERGLI